MGACSYLIKAQLFALLICLVYMASCFLLGLPEAQRQYLFLHQVRFPPFAQYDRPHKYGTPRT